MNTRLTTLEQEVEVTIDGETFTEVQNVGFVTRAYPRRVLVDGVWVDNAEGDSEFIRLHFLTNTYLWAASLDDYDPETNSHDPATDARWEVE